MIKFFITGLCLFIGIITISCNNRERNITYIKSQLTGKVYIPENFTKDTINGNIYGRFAALFFKNDTTMYKIGSHHLFRNDTLFLAVSETYVNIYIGNYNIESDTLFTHLTIPITNDSIPIYRKDTLRISKLDKGVQINYKDISFRPYPIIYKESFKRIEDIISVGYPLCQGFDTVNYYTNAFTD